MDLNKALTQDMFDSYNSLLSLSGLSLMIVSKSGEVLHEYVPLPEFCKRVCREGWKEDGGERRSCLETAGSRGGCDQCPNGLSRFAIPIQWEGEALGYLTGGHVYQDNRAYQKYMLDVPRLAKSAGVEPDFVAKALSMLQTVSQEKLEAHEELGKYIAHNISQKLLGLQKRSRSVEKDILEWRIIGQSAKSSVMEVDANILFNMLNCLARVAYFEGASKTEDLIYQLSDLLRFNAQARDSIHTVGAELEHIEKYLYIQKARFQSRLRYTVDVPDHIRSVHILNAVLLPLVDNALVHGIMLRKDGGELHIRGISKGGQVTFFLIDHGKGFPQEVLKSLRAKSFLDKEGGSLCRINGRLKRYYGEAYGLDVVKSDASGSTVSITIPKNIVKR